MKLMLIYKGVYKSKVYSVKAEHIHYVLIPFQIFFHYVGKFEHCLQKFVIFNQGVYTYSAHTRITPTYLAL